MWAEPVFYHGCKTIKMRVNWQANCLCLDIDNGFQTLFRIILQTAIMIGIACLPTHTKLELKSKYTAHNVRVCKAKTKERIKSFLFLTS